MSEKAFFHNALESDLLSGRKQKRRLDAVLGRTKAAPATAAPVRGKTKKESALKRWIYIPAVAVLLMLTVALGAVVIMRGLRNEQRQAEQPIVSEKQVLLSESAEIRLLSELDPESRIERARSETSGLSAYNEADWSWLREATAAVTGLSATADSIRWTVELRVPKGERTDNPLDTLVEVTRGMPLCFFHADSGLDTPDEGAQLVEFASPGEITFSETADEWIAYVPEICAMPQTYNQFPAVLPPTGEVKITNTLLLLDRSVLNATTEYVDFSEDGTGETVEYPAALLGTIEHTFVFDAEALLNIADPVHIDVPLSGETVLTTHVNNGFRNERVTLDGVTLDAEIHYMKAGVFAILTIKNAGTLSDAQQEALYAAMNGGPDGSHFSVGCEAATGSLRVWRVSRAFWGQTKLARYEIALEPSQYDAAGQLELSVRATYATGIEGDEPRDDWSWVSSEGNLPELMTKAVPIASITIPLPGVSLANMPNPLPSQAPTRCPPTEEPDPMPILDEATLCTTWMLAEVEAPDGSSGDARALGLEQYLVFRSDGTVRIIDAKAPSERVVPYTQNGNTVRFDGRVLRYDSEYNELVEIDPSSQDILFYTPSPVPTPTPVP